MNDLTPHDFDAFHEEVHGVSPFPWQRRALMKIAAERRFPDLVDLPTGTGKTTLMDMAVFLLAMDAQRPREARWMPRRIFLVVDRRVIVDQAGARALALSQILGAALRDGDGDGGPTPGDSDSVVRRVALALSSLTGGGEPLVPAILRGGTLRDDNWARRPDQPVLGASTVDQVGSRLLFSGYGVGNLAASVHAGLLGRDTLFLLDEVHLSRPFRDTLRDIRAYAGPGWCETPVGVPNQFVELSATPNEEGGEEGGDGLAGLAGLTEFEADTAPWADVPGAARGVEAEAAAAPDSASATPSPRSVFRLEPEDREHPLIRERLAARKPIRLVELPSGAQSAFVAAMVRAATQLLETHRTIAVVANRVASAREVYAALEPLARRKGRGFDVFLVTGRMRPLDRQDLMDQIEERIRAGRTRDADARPLILVATQCIEAGADLDFDALVTECAALDALKQRFGRVDRLGRYGQAEGVIVARKTDVSASAGDDPVYGPALRDTWQWLQKIITERGPDGEPIDLGPDGLAQLEARPELATPSNAAPIMLPAHLDAWAQTGPAPPLQPDVALWLHGPEDRARDVQIVWRADLEPEEFVEAARFAHGKEGDGAQGGPAAKGAATGEGGRAATGEGEGALASLLDRLAFCPPSSPETLSVPLKAVRGWLAIEAAFESDVLDVEGAREKEAPARKSTRTSGRIRPVLLVQGDRSSILTSARDLRPGMTLVVPHTYGGLTAGTWDPQATTPVPDLGDRAQLIARGRLGLRLHPALQPTGSASTNPLPYPRQDETRSRSDDLDDLQRWLDAELGGGGTGEGKGVGVGKGESGSKASGEVSADAQAPWRAVALRELRRLGARGLRLQRFQSGGERPRSWWGVHARKRCPMDVLIEIRNRERGVAPQATGSGAGAGSASGLEFFIEDFDLVEHSSFVAREVSLDEHLEAVGDLAASYARNLGLADALHDALRWAGRLHDVGKADRRFQLWLHGGDEIDLAATGRMLAKSPLPQQDRVARRVARERSGYPRGLRHEMASTAMVAGSPEAKARLPEADLVLHLIASHHGWGRPFAPAVEDRAPIPVKLSPNEEGWPELACSSDETLASVDSGVAERFWALTQRFGWHGLAYLEAILRLADHRVSEAEANR
jgi:CRISPR-associated endonuclease/helicase Cas3